MSALIRINGELSMVLWAHKSPDGKTGTILVDRGVKRGREWLEVDIEDHEQWAKIENAPHGGVFNRY